MFLTRFVRFSVIIFRTFYHKNVGRPTNVIQNTTLTILSIVCYII